MNIQRKVAKLCEKLGPRWKGLDCIQIQGKIKIWFLKLTFLLKCGKNEEKKFFFSFNMLI